MPKTHIRGNRERIALQRSASDTNPQTMRALLAIRELLLRGEFSRGERLSEIPLVARLGVSRTPIRLALERLAHMGLLEANSVGGFVVREFTVPEVRDAIELRGLLEGMAARLAAERLRDTADLEPLHRYYQRMSAVKGLTIDSFGEYIDANEAFHAVIVDLAGNAMLRRSLEQVFSLPFASPSAMVFPTSRLPDSEDTLFIAQEQHRAIIEAIGKRQGTRAESLAREHALIGRRVLDSALSDDDALSKVPGGSLIKTSSR